MTLYHSMLDNNTLCFIDLPPLPSTTRPPPLPSTTRPPPLPGTTTSSVPATTSTPLPGSGFCGGKADGLYCNKEDLNAFYQCASGHTYLQKCAANLIFNEKCKCCDWNMSPA